MATTLLFVILVVLSLHHHQVTAAAPAATPRPIVGAIRWDAWNGVPVDNVSYWATKALSPNEWHARLPFFGNVTGENSVQFNGDTQAVMDAEIKYAATAGLDFWAFDTYCAYPSNASVPECQAYLQHNHGYMPKDPAYGLRRYLASQHRDKINFALILLGAPAAAPAFVAHTVSLLQQPTYQRITDAAGSLRPLMFLFQASQAAANSVGGWGAWKQRFNDLRAASVAAGAGNPYIVAMEFTPKGAQLLMTNLGLDAVSTYAIPQQATTSGTPFVNETNYAQGWWEEAAQLGLKVVPQAPTGWDPRPRAQNEPPWVHEGPQHFVHPTQSQLANMVTTATRWTCANPEAAESKAVLMCMM